MILYTPTKRQEHNLRVEYVNSPEYNYNDWLGYRQYALAHVPGCVEAGYRGGDDPDTIETLVFDEEQFLTWFIMRYS